MGKTESPWNALRASVAELESTQAAEDVSSQLADQKRALRSLLSSADSATTDTLLPVMAGLVADLRHVHKVHRSSAKAIDKSKKERQNLEAEIVRVSQQNEKLQSLSRQLQQASRRDRETHESAMLTLRREQEDKLNAYVTGFKDQLDTIKVSLDDASAVKESNDVLRAQVEEMKSRDEKMQAHADKVQELIGLQKNMLDEQGTRLEAMAKDLTKERERSLALATRLEETEKEKVTWFESIHGIQTSIEELRASNDELNEQKKTLLKENRKLFQLGEEYAKKLTNSETARKEASVELLKSMQQRQEAMEKATQIMVTMKDVTERLQKSEARNGVLEGLSRRLMATVKSHGLEIEKEEREEEEEDNVPRKDAPLPAEKEGKVVSPPVETKENASPNTIV